MVVEELRRRVGGGRGVDARRAEVVGEVRRVVGYIRIPEPVRRVMEVLRRYGYEVYAVGGAVRDSLMGREPHDWDLATSCPPSVVMDILRREGFKVYEKGIEFGTVATNVDGTEIEITTFRREMYREDRGRKPIVEFSTSVEDDVRRRDFTVNALLADADGRVIDLVGGLRDLLDGVIRFVGDPAERIREDPLRMLRALRFAAKLGFEIDPASYEAIRSRWSELRRVSWERIRDEILKAAETPMFHYFVWLLYDSNLYRYVMPELEEMDRVRHAPDTPNHYGESVLEHTIDVLQRLDEIGAPPLVKIAALLHDVGKPLVAEGEVSKSFHRHEVVGAERAREILRRWRMSGRDIDRIVAAVRWHMLPHQYAVQDMDPKEMARRLFAKLGPETAMDVLYIAYGDTGDPRYLEALREVQRLAEARERKPLVTGYDIMRRYGLKPGPWIGEIKQALYELQLTRNITSKEQLFEEAEKEGVVQRILMKYGLS